MESKPEINRATNVCQKESQGTKSMRPDGPYCLPFFQVAAACGSARSCLGRGGSRIAVKITSLGQGFRRQCRQGTGRISRTGASHADAATARQRRHTSATGRPFRHVLPSFTPFLGTFFGRSWWLRACSGVAARRLLRFVLQAAWCSGATLCAMSAAAAASCGGNRRSNALGSRRSSACLSFGPEEIHNSLHDRAEQGCYAGEHVDAL